MKSLSFKQTKLKKRIFFASLCLAICTFLIFFEDLNWVLSLFSHFIIQYTLGSIVLLFLAVLARDFRSIGINFVTLSIVLALIINRLNWVAETASSSATEPHSVRIFSANLLVQNKDEDSLRQIIAEINPDVIVLLETNEWWINALKSYHENYPYFINEPREDNFGISVLSKINLSDSKVRYFNERIPFIETLVEHKTAKFNLIAVHTLPPISSEYKESRDQQMKEIAEESSRKSEPLVIIGDFNDTPWSSNFKRFLKVSQTKMAGISIKGTWTTRLPPFGIQLDHALVKNLKVSDFRVHRSIGSDHYPISLRVLLEE